jgi:hypothetical protein
MTCRRNCLILTGFWRRRDKNQFRAQNIEVYRTIIDLRDGKQLIWHDYA